MNKDFRVTVTAPSHLKTKKLMKQLGDRSFYNLVTLWAYTAANKPNGKLTGMDQDDIEITADWKGEHLKFTATLIKLKFLDEQDGIYSIHNWKKHNGYAFHAEERSKKAKRAAEIRWESSNKNKELMLNDATSMLQAMPQACLSNAPSPVPSPVPNPVPNKLTDVSNVGNATKVKEEVKEKEKVDIKAEDKKEKYLDFVLLTKAEYEKLINKYSEAIVKSKIQDLNDYIGSKGKKYKSHYFTILSWLRKDDNKQGNKEPRMIIL